MGEQSTSQDAQFLKPTVVTLVFGLGFGMFIILFLVQSLISMQKDIKSCFYSLREILFGEVSKPLKRQMWGLISLLLISFLILMGQYIFIGDLGAVFPHILPFLPYSLSIFLTYCTLLVVLPVGFLALNNNIFSYSESEKQSMATKKKK